MARNYISRIGYFNLFYLNGRQPKKDLVNWSVLGTADDIYMQPRYWHIKLPRGTTNIHIELPYSYKVWSYEDMNFMDNLYQQMYEEHCEGIDDLDNKWSDDELTYNYYVEVRHLYLKDYYPDFYFDAMKDAEAKMGLRDSVSEIGSLSPTLWTSGENGWFDIFSPLLTYEGSVTSIYTNGDSNTSIQVFHTDGRLLIGTPLTGYDRCRETMFNGGTDCYVGFHDKVTRYRYPTDNHYMQACMAKDATEYGARPACGYPASATGAALWEKCGLWADWYSYFYALLESDFNPLDPNHMSDRGYRPVNGYQVTPADLDRYLHKIDPKVFTSADFHFNDTFVNGTGQPLWRTSDDQQTIVVEGETIKWTGNSGGPWATPFMVGASFLGNVYDFERMEIADHNQWPGYSLGPRSLRFKNLKFKTKPNEVLDIEELQFDSIIMIPAIYPYNAFGWYDLPDLPTYSPGVSLCKGRPRLWRLKDGVEGEETE